MCVFLIPKRPYGADIVVGPDIRSDINFATNKETVSPLVKSYTQVAGHIKHMILNCFHTSFTRVDNIENLLCITARKILIALGADTSISVSSCYV